MTRNRWSVSENERLCWYAELPQDDSALTQWRQLALRSGEALSIYRVESLPDIGFDRGAHGPLLPFLQDNPRLDEGILLLDRYRVTSSRLSVADATGRIVEQDVIDLGNVLDAAPFHAPVRYRRPLSLGVEPGRAGTIRATVSAYSDIWLPWCSAYYEPDADDEDFADNTALATGHTPRLNEWLAELRECTQHLGGTWGLDRDITDRDLLFELDDQGVRLDATQPFVRTSEAPVMRPGLDDVFGALRIALEWFEIEPPPPSYSAVIRATVSTPEHELYAAGRAQVLNALRHPGNPAVKLTSEELRGISRIDIDNHTDRHSFTVQEILS